MQSKAQLANWTTGKLAYWNLNAGMLAYWTADLLDC
jgi:hypothetical protein